MIWDGMNRREFPRADYPCTVRVRRKGDTEEFHTHTENIGCGGICVMLPKDIGMFNSVEMKIDLKNGQQNINCDGTVIWVVRRSEFAKDAPNSFDTGIEFVNLDEEAKLRIDKIVKECSQRDK